MNVLVTGANGFIGRAVVNSILRCGLSVRIVNRGNLGSLPDRVQRREEILVGAINSKTDWGGKLDKIDVIVHCAAVVSNKITGSGKLDQHMTAVNVDGTLNLARQAAKHGIQRFVFISSAKVNGESTDGRPPFTSEDEPAPESPYAVTKLMAEIGLKEIASSSKMEMVIIRPPLVYGPGVKGNFRTMINLVGLGVPLPFKQFNNNRRSLIALDNLVDLIVHCVTKPTVGNSIILPSDGFDLSTTEIFYLLGASMGCGVKLFAVPSNIVYKLAAVPVFKERMNRFARSFQIKVSHNEKCIGWTPKISVQEGFYNVFKKTI